jgi:hypothetical protein
MKNRINLFMLSGENDYLKTLLRDMHRGIVNHYSTKLFGVEITDHNYVSIADKLRTKQRTYIDMIYTEKFKSCDVAIQFGGVKARETLHHAIKTDIKDKANNIVFLETPLLGRKIDKNNSYDHYRLGLNGFLNGEGDFYNKNCPSDRWQEIAKKYGYSTTFTGWKDHTKGPILLITQLPGDSSLRHQNHGEWICNIIRKIRLHTNREIRIRLHPGLSDKGKSALFGDIKELFINNVSNIHFSTNQFSHQDFAECGIVVSYTSGTSVEAIIHGVPVVAVDQGNFAWDISSKDIHNIVNPVLAEPADVNQWLNNLAYAQWTVNEIKSGKAWSHIVQAINNKE